MSMQVFLHGARVDAISGYVTRDGRAAHTTLRGESRDEQVELFFDDPAEMRLLSRKLALLSEQLESARAEQQEAV